MVTIPTTFIVRHGERLDHIDKLWQPDPSLGIWDPPMTTHGFEQAELTGHEIVKMMCKQDLRNPNIIIYTSPFQRCIDTSVGILKGIGQKSNTLLRLDIGLGEWMCERFFDSVCPAQHLLSRQQEKLARQQAHAYSMMAKMNSPQETPLSIDYAYSNNSIHEFDYPERYTDMIHRFEETRLQCLESASRTKFKNGEEPTVVIFVTHAVGVNALLDGFRDRVTIPLESNYCSISCVRRANAAAVGADFSDQSDEDCEFTQEEIPSTKSKWSIDTVMYSGHLTC